MSKHIMFCVRAPGPPMLPVGVYIYISLVIEEKLLVTFDGTIFIKIIVLFVKKTKKKQYIVLTDKNQRVEFSGRRGISPHKYKTMANFNEILCIYEVECHTQLSKFYHFIFFLIYAFLVILRFTFRGPDFLLFFSVRLIIFLYRVYFRHFAAFRSIVYELKSRASK